MPKKIFIIAGEPSGDLHGSSLIIELLIKSPDLEIIGMGGELMQAAGAKLSHKIGKLSVIGFAEVLKKIPHYRRLFKNLASELNAEKPDLVILIDFPGFNLPFAKEAKKRNIPVIYYISPQVWAWHKSRIKTIKKLVDKMLVLFEFEKDMYKQYGIDAVFTGHPLVDAVKTTANVGANNYSPLHFGLDPNKKIIGLLPGSRLTEVKKVLPIMLKTAQIISKEHKNTQFIIIKSPIINEDVYVGAARRVAPTLRIKIIADNRYDAMNCCDLALVASGTATLETAMLGIPMVLVYKVAFLTWLIARALIRIPYIGLVNVVAGKKIIPEFIQFNAIASKIAAESIDLLNNPSKTKLMRSELMKVRESLGPAGASERAADEILAFLNAGNANTGRVS